MASIISAIKCPHCGRSAVEEFDYKTDEKTIACYRCGFYYSKRIKSFATNPIKFTEEKCEGYGVFIVMKKDGNKKVTLFNEEILQEKINEYQKEFSHDEMDKEKSFLVTYREGVFIIHCGNPSENFHLSFEQYKIKMFKKYESDDLPKCLVPIEE